MTERTAMGAIKTVTDDTFDSDVLRSPRPVIVEYWAQWCPPCRMLGPVLEQIAQEQAGTIDVVKLNTDENPVTAQKYGVLAVPTMNVFSGGQVVKQIIGAKSKSALLRDFAEFL
jgi:thioredoxin 1